MKRLCFPFILISIFNSAFGQSRIIGQGGGHSSTEESSLYNPIDPDARWGHSRPGNLPSSAQAFQPGVIITKAGDTLSGLIKYSYNLPIYTISYKPNELSTDSIISVQEIKSLITQYVYLTKVPFAGKDEMMPWLSVGKINLYSFVKYYGTGFTGITYALEKNNQFTYISKKDFNIMMKHVFFDDPDMLQKIGKKGYRYDNMIKIVMDYNKRFL